MRCQGGEGTHLLLQLYRLVGAAVPFGVRVHVAQTEVRREVHHLDARWQVTHNLLCGAVWQAAEHGVHVRVVRILHSPQPCARS